MLSLSIHTRRRMAERRITEAEIEEALGNPGTTYPSEDDPDTTVVLGTTEMGRRLKVVVASDVPTFVITVADRDQE